VPPTKYGFSHPDLPEPIPVTIRQHAQKVVDAWPGATLVARTLASKKGIRGLQRTWTAWAPVTDKSQLGAGEPVAPPNAEMLQLTSAVAR
jgi:hypothetical protein